MVNKLTVLVCLALAMVAFTLLARVEPASAAVDDIEVGDITIRIFQETGATQADIEYVRAVLVDLLAESPDHFKKYVEHSTQGYIFVRVYRDDPAVLGGRAVWGGSGGFNIVLIDLDDNDAIMEYLEGFSESEKQTIFQTKDEQTLAHEFYHMNGTYDPQLMENDVLTDIGAGWQRIDYYGECRASDKKYVIGLKVGTKGGVLNLTDWEDDWGPDVPEGGVWPYPTKCGGSVWGGVGGIAELPDVEALPADITNTASPDHTGLAWTFGGAAAGIFIVVASGTVWFARRRRPS